MSKISVGETIFRGYGFAARRILSNLGLTWLAAVFYAVAAAYWLQQFCTTMLVSPHPGSELNDFALFDLVGLVVTTALGSAVIARGLTGAALEPGGETMTAYFAVAKREWILFLSLLRLYAFVVAALFAVILLGRLAITMALPMIGANVRWQGIGALPAMDVAVAAVAFIVTAMLAVRLGFFAAPVASAERSTSMVRAWSLSRGNSWRVFVAAIGLSVPALLLWVAAEWTLIGNDLTGTLTTALSPSHNSTALYQLLDNNASAIAGMWTLLIVVLNMLFAGASAPAYLTVRDNVSVRQQRSIQRAPVMEPAFAGSFAGFAPRDAKEPVASNVAPHTESAPEVFTAVPAPESEAPITAMEMPAETFVAEPHAVDAGGAQASFVEPVAEPEAALPQMDASAAPVHEHDAHDPLILADEVHEPAAAQDEAGIAAERTTVMQFPLGADSPAEHPVEHFETALGDHHAEMSEIIPLPSRGDETESSQQNAPSEAA